MGIFVANTSIRVNGENFAITGTTPCTAPGMKGTFQLTGTRESDPSLLAGKRTIFTAYLEPRLHRGNYYYDWAAR